MSAFRPFRPFRARRDDSIETRLSSDEVDLLIQLEGELLDVLAGRAGAGAIDPAFDRLIPDAYPDDAEASAEFRHYTEDDLLERKSSNAREVLAALTIATPDDEDRVARLTRDQAASLLRNLTDLRLTIAVRLDIHEDGDEGAPGEENDFTRSVYWWLGTLQEALVGVLQTSLTR